MNTVLEPLKIERLDLKDVNLYALKDCTDELYCRQVARAKYIFLSKEDYRAICLQLERDWHARPNNTRNTFSVMQLYGMFIAPFPNVPQEKEYAQARLTFEYLEYNMTALKKGEVIILYAER